uniref:Uncharacterized protein n=1 Tax=Entomoneis paludosa TaxID=265537 RepID=A0A7S2YN79_9STRA|mmetsp:Transcript_39543/g.82136  ORF Transcript_39543/g.82136 Transcript_39543/m.82136 type:complete len:116 (+) Transcript_39543:1131-1478(+)
MVKRWPWSTSKKKQRTYLDESVATAKRVVVVKQAHKPRREFCSDPGDNPRTPEQSFPKTPSSSSTRIRYKRKKQGSGLSWQSTSDYSVQEDCIIPRNLSIPRELSLELGDDSSVE